MIKRDSCQERTTSAYDEACKMQFKGKSVITLKRGRTDLSFMVMVDNDREKMVNGLTNKALFS